jgi:hypothetical protein
MTRQRLQKAADPHAATLPAPPPDGRQDGPVLLRRERFWLPGRLPGLNDLLFTDVRSAIRTRRAPHAAIALLAQAARIRPFDGPVRVTCEWHEPNKRRDPDGIVGGGTKCLLDGLVNAGVLKGDGWRHIAALTHTWRVAKEPGVWVTLEEVGS